jgi:tripartite-type tricarboxylate transporter receptor subunit TctC
MERKDPGYDLASFRFLFFFGKSLVFFSVKSDSKWNTFKDFLKDAQNNPGKLKYASVGPGSVYNMTVDMLCKAAGGVKLTHVPFKSSPESLTALAGGNVDMAVTFSLTGVGKSGLIRTLAISGDKRVPNYSDIPSLAELGYPIKYEASEHGLAAPAKTPEKIVSKLLDAHNKVRVKYAKEMEEKFAPMDVFPIYVDGKGVLEVFKMKERLVKDFHDQIGFKPE